MYQFAMLLALGLCAEPQDTNKSVSPVPDVAKISADLKSVMERLDKIEQTVRTNNDNQNKDRNLASESLQNQINDVIKKVGDMRAELDATKRHNASQSEKRADSMSATVLLVNARSDMPMETLVNGTMYHVEPNQNRTVSVPAGALRVRIMATDNAIRERVLETGATHVVTLR